MLVQVWRLVPARGLVPAKGLAPANAPAKPSRQSAIFFSLIAIFIFLFTACTPPETPYRPSAASHDPQTIHELGQALTDVIVHDVFSPPVAARIYSYSHLAAYEALRWDDAGDYPSLTQQMRGFVAIPEPQDDGAPHCFPLVAAHAMIGVSKMLVFSDTMLDRKAAPIFKRFAALHLPKAVESRSKAYAEKIVAAIAQRIKTDNYKETRGFSRYTPQSIPGHWEPTPPEYMDAIEPHWHKLLPFVLDSASQFKPIPPAPYSQSPGSPFYRDMLFVYETSKQLSEEQKAIANFWDCNPFVTHNEGHLMFATKKITPGGHWMGITRIVCQKTKADLVKSAWSYALTAVTLNEAFISCWDEKYRSAYVRPETAIRALKDPKWFPLLQTPPFPEYTSGHSVVSSASAVVLTHLYGDSFAYVDSVEVIYGLPPRSFPSFSAAATEASRSRLYGGIHFLPAIENGVKQGQAIGNYLIQQLNLKR
ncbi:vanadium-dependent haloperoxidase [Haliscomenobacter sp.]|uniref:vanadium-dependent haloperoxidase n=1 Tax=Haliscomenobacter sp. TaxID=2717303 RepID=UPI003BACEAEA